MAIEKESLMKIIHILSTKIVTHGKYFIAVIAIIILGIGLFFLNHTWSKYRDESAQYALSHLIEQFDNNQHSSEPQWEDFLNKAHLEYEKHSSSRLAPYFLGYIVQALEQQNKKEEVLATLETIIAKNNSSLLVSFYKLAGALTKLDLSTEGLRAEGLNELIELAHDNKNQCVDTALFYLGRYYWSRNEITLAQEAWERLIEEQRNEKLAPSPWVGIAKEYLETIAS
jgi:predicted negative regulator of RcsB-dependent stress response